MRLIDTLVHGMLTSSPVPYYQAEKTLERMAAEGLVTKPFVPKRKAFTFPPVEKMGQRVGRARRHG